MSDPATGADGTRSFTTPSETDPDANSTIAAPAGPPRSCFAEIPGYEILGELGRGGMGVVYRARQLALNREVAIKMILSGDHAGGADVARFRIEAEALARLHNPHIVTVFEIGECGGLPFFTMEYCPGGSLASAGRGSLTAKAAAELLLGICQGIAAAHAAGIVHRDIKPGNVLLAADGTPKVSDFGLAKRMDRIGSGDAGELTGTGAVMGTPSYMAPEQAGSAKRVGPAADVYALGAMLYELLTGRPPFRGPTATDTLLLLLTEDVRPPRELCPSVPRDLEAVCLRCLERDPTQRYPTATELAEDLVKFLAGEPVSSVRSGFVGRLTHSMERVQLHERFAAYGTLLLALAPVMFLPEIWNTVVIRNGWSVHLLTAGNCSRVVAFLTLVGYFRGWRFSPQGPLERHLWTVWGGYLLTCFGIGISQHLALGLWYVSVAPQLYQSLACLTALAFFALASTVWGYCAAAGFGFLALSLVMAIDLQWAPLEFGAAWATVLILIGVRLRRLAREHTPPI